MGRQSRLVFVAGSVAGRDPTESHCCTDVGAGSWIFRSHDGLGIIACRVQTRDSLAALVNHLGMLVSRNTKYGGQRCRNNSDRIEWGFIHRANVGIGRMLGVPSSHTKFPFALMEVFIASGAGKTVIPVHCCPQPGGIHADIVGKLLKRVSRMWVAGDYIFLYYGFWIVRRGDHSLNL